MKSYFVVTFGWEGLAKRHKMVVKYSDDLKLWFCYDETTETYRGPMFHSYNELYDWISDYTLIQEAG